MAEEDQEALANALNNNSSTPTKTTTPAPRVCNICGKTFSNGKALGGHRRSHFQASKKLLQQKKVKARFSSKTVDDDVNHSYDRANCDYGVDDVGVDDDDGKRICSICKKEFPSKNGLYGHMRTHPERDWRGVCPPNTANHSLKHFSSPNSSSSHYFLENNNNNNKEDEEEGDFVDDKVSNVVAPKNEEHRVNFDLAKLTSPSWLKRDQRGRRCTGLFAAAETLAYIYAKYAKKFCGEPSSSKKAKVEPRSVSTPPIKKRKNGISIGESSSGAKNVVKKIKFYLKGEMKMENKRGGYDDCDEDDHHRGKRVCENVDDDDYDEDVNEGFDDVNVEESGDKLEDERKRKKVEKGKNISENEGQQKLGGYKCGTCGKSFSTFQGLGGHRSIHKEKNIVVSMDEPKHSEAVAEENPSCSSSKVDEEASLDNEETLAEEASQSAGPKGLDFDLNQPYVMDEEEG